MFLVYSEMGPDRLNRNNEEPGFPQIPLFSELSRCVEFRDTSEKQAKKNYK